MTYEVSASQTVLHLVAFSLFYALLLPLTLFAQSPRGSLRGVVQDATGGRIASATISIQAAESTVQRQASTNEAV